MRRFSATLKSRNHPEKEKYVFFVVFDKDGWEVWKNAKQSLLITLELKGTKYGVIVMINPDFAPGRDECEGFARRVDSVIMARCNPISLIQIDHGLYESFQLTEDPDFSLVLIVADQEKNEEEIVREFLNRTKKFRS